MGREKMFESGYDLQQKVEKVAKIEDKLRKKDLERVDHNILKNLEKGKNLDYILEENRVKGKTVDGKEIDLMRKFETSSGEQLVDQEDLIIVDDVAEVKKSSDLKNILHYDKFLGKINGENIEIVYGNEFDYDISKKEIPPRYEEIKKLFLDSCAIARLQEKENGGVLNKNHGKTVYEVMAEKMYNEENPQQEERKAA
jgi:hypothetical protein